jgi:hypothetical protein
MIQYATVDRARLATMKAADIAEVYSRGWGTFGTAMKSKH